MISSNLTIIVNNTHTEASNPEISFDSLVRRLKAGEAKAFTELYENYAPALMGIITRIVNSTECAEDILQETFIKISRSISSYDSQKGRLFTWMAATARNTALDLLRSRSQSNSKKTEDLDSLAEKTFQKHATNNNPELIGLRQLTCELPAPQKEALDLIYFQGYTHTEAAEALNIPLGTLKTRIRNSILALRKSFNYSAIPAYSSFDAMYKTGNQFALRV